MSLLDRAITHPRVFQCRIRRICTDMQPLRNTCVHKRCCCYAKVKLDDDEQELPVSHRVFSIRVPTIPKLGDIESARRLLESAFQNLSFDMSKIPIDSALQGLIPKLSITMPVLVLDITGFVVTKLKKPQKKVLEDLHVDESQYPRCAWPRALKGSRVNEIENSFPVGNQYELEVSQQTPVGPHCAWPRATRQLAATSGFSLSTCSASPRGSISASGATLASEAPSTESARKEEDISSSPCIVEGGPRCPWPRKSFAPKQSHSASEVTVNAEQFEAENQSGQKVRPGCDNSAELQRRMLATSVGLTIVNNLAKGSIMTSFFDLHSLLPAGSLGIPEEEDAAIDKYNNPTEALSLNDEAFQIFFVSRCVKTSAVGSVNWL
ncbi:hypothetical protein L7F22_043206 [Adiantum nelumboides]|nr:hypothetical protein [Adiantum nelumboides]